MVVQYDDMLNKLKSILLKKGFSDKDAYDSARIFTTNSADGVYSHGYIRFLTVISYIDKGYIDCTKKAIKLNGFNAFEQWDGQLGIGILNATSCMKRATELAEKYGISIISLKNTNHWMRGATYAFEACDSGFISICWSNSYPTMSPWGGNSVKIGNNPLVIGIPRENKKHIVLDMAMSQFSYGKIQEYSQNNSELPMYGGYDKNKNLTKDPNILLETKDLLPMGYWKGSGLSILLDLTASLLSVGNAVCDIARNEVAETTISQVFIAINPKCFSSENEREDIIAKIINDVKSSATTNKNSVLYPGERALKTRELSMKNGILVDERIWNKICSL